MLGGVERRCLQAGGNYPLTYCTNAHPARGRAEFEEVLRARAAPCLRAALDPGGEGALLALGAWWPEDLVRELEEEDAFAAHAALLETLGLVPLSLNVFPQARFHGVPVKERVYEPDWADERRLAYTLRAARLQAALLAGAGFEHGALSTVPLGFRGRDRRARPARAHAENLRRAALALADLAAETGVHLVLALEPEPFCLLETVEEAVAWLQEEACPAAAALGLERALRRICLDLCHAAVTGEDPVAAAEGCRRAGFRVPKVQLSAAYTAEGAAGLRALRALAEPVWLHQTWVEGAAGGPFLDLDEPGLAALAEGPARGITARCHFHAPLHLERDGALRTTAALVRSFLERAVRGLLEPGTILEVETYTRADLAPEVAWAAAVLEELPYAPRAPEAGARDP